MSETIQLSVGYNKINATWIDRTAIWLSDYHPHRDPELETLQLERHTKNLTADFRRYDLLDPTVEILGMEGLDTDAGDRPAARKVGGQLLRVTTLLMPYVDPRYLRPVLELRMPALTPQQAEGALVEQKLRAGGQAIYNAFGSAMTGR